MNGILDWRAKANAVGSFFPYFKGCEYLVSTEPYRVPPGMRKEIIIGVPIAVTYGLASDYQPVDTKRSRVELSPQAQAASDHLGYLNRMVVKRVVPAEVSLNARLIWELARKAVPGLSVPAAVAYEGGPIHYTWDNGRHQVTVESHSDAPCDWYVSDRTSGQFDGGEFDPAAGLPELLIAGLKRVAE